MNKKSMELFFVILFILYFIFDLLQYMNWFLPLSLFSHSGHKSWFVFIANVFCRPKVVLFQRKERKRKFNYCLIKIIMKDLVVVILLNYNQK